MSYINLLQHYLETRHLTPSKASISSIQGPLFS